MTDGVKIIHISAVCTESASAAVVYGLGDDGKIYMWQRRYQSWRILD